MSTITATYDRVWDGHPINLSHGQTISVENMSGLSLKALAGETWRSVSSPYTADADCLVRLDCVTYTSPVTAVLSIT